MKKWKEKMERKRKGKKGRKKRKKERTEKKKGRKGSKKLVTPATHLKFTKGKRIQLKIFWGEKKSNFSKIKICYHYLNSPTTN